jgi:aryl-alcohol dehydrogenase-like predicted oxidoreductase
VVGIGRDTISGLMPQMPTQWGGSLPKLSIAWVLANPTITSAILGASRPDQLTDTLAACDLKIDAEIKNKLDEITAEYRFGDSAR